MACCGRTVLLLEQNQEAKHNVRRALEAAGYTVWDAVNGLRLISRLHVDRPDVVVMDTDQAWTDCFDLCLSLKRSEQFRNVRVVLLDEGAELPERARACCCDRYLPRASGPEDLIDAIQELLDPVDEV